MPVRIAVDVASGDFGTPVMVQGVLEALRGRERELHPVLCGHRDAVSQALAAAGWSGEGIEIEHCPDTLASGDAPARVWKRKRGAPIIRCVALQREGRADASVCAGDTGTLLAAALFILGRQHGAKRPALAATFPTLAGRPALLLDVGANLECRAEHLVSFALMGAGYVGRYYGVERPAVALLNVGEEPSKGTRTIAEAGRVLAAKCPGYRGFIEASRVLSGDAQVIVCDGFVGNAMIKLWASFHALTESVLAGRADVLETVRKSMTILNPESYGAVPILGIQGIVLKAHGNSSPRAIANAVTTAMSVVRQGVIPVARGATRGHHHGHAS
jgi:glycerol-3-phosphate acyltransferase PlsX